MDQSVPSTTRPDAYRAVTDRIVKAIEAGAGEFVMPWHRRGPGIERPANALTGNRYRGVNVVALWAEAYLAGFGSGHFASFLQWQELGARVRRGERGSMIVFYREIEPDNAPQLFGEGEDGEGAQNRFVLKSSYVFNADQVEGWTPPGTPQQATPVETIEKVERFVRATEAEIRHGGSIACYRPGLDRIDLPHREAFLGTPTSTPTEAYYATLLHELVHWTGAKHRLNRTFGAKFGDAAYAAEELVAEVGAAFLCADLAVSNEPRRDHAAYLSRWLEIMKSDTRAIFVASRLATEATDHLFGITSPAMASEP